MKLRKDEWRKLKLGEVCDFINGRTFKMEELLEEGTPVLRVGNFFSNNKWYYSDLILEEKSYCNPGDLLYAWSASFGPKIWDGPRAIFHTHIWRVELTDKILKEFLFVYLDKETENIKHAAHGTTMLHITKAAMKNYPLILPPLEEQKQIAALFQSIETAVEQVEGQEKNLKSLEKTLSNGLVKKTPVFGNLLSDNNCSPCTFGDITACIEKHNKKPLEVGITRFVGLEFIEAENFNLQGFGSIEKGTTFTKCFLKGDVLFGKRRAYLKKVAVADFDGICSGDILVFRAIKAKILPELLPYYVSSDAFIQHAVSTSAGSLSPRTKWKDLEVLEISIPDLKTQKKIAETFQQLQNAIGLLQQQITNLKNLKQKLLSEILG